MNIDDDYLTNFHSNKRQAQKDSQNNYTLTTDNRLVWIDLEMTGLDINSCQIIEIATIITDNHLNILGVLPEIAIHQPQSYLDQMDEWCTKTHTQSGLVERVKKSEMTLEIAEQNTLDFIKQWVEPNTAPLCGNSIGTDRQFIAKYMPKLNAHLHYRNIDVSTLKELVYRWYPEFPKFKKKNNHLALDDIKESIAECLYYKNNFFNK